MTAARTKQPGIPDFLAGILDEPAWLECSTDGCDRETSGQYCGECQRAFARKAELTKYEQEAIELIPERWRWCERSHSLMAERIGAIQFAEDGLAPTKVDDGQGGTKVVMRPSGAVHTPSRAIARILAAPQPIVTLVGPSGAGKTCISAALMRACGMLDFAEWTDATKLGEASFESHLGERAHYLRRAERARFLVIDELRDPKHASKAANVYGVLNDRHGLSKSKTIVTTGMSQAQLDMAFGSAAVRRLMEPESACVVYIQRRVAAERQQ